MFVCLCFGVSDKKIKKLVDQGTATLRELQKECQAGQSCGTCLKELKVEFEKARTTLETEKFVSLPQTGTQSVG